MFRFRGFLYLFELDHNVFGQLHVLKHPLQLTSKRCSALCRKSKPTNIRADVLSQYFIHSD